MWSGTPGTSPPPQAQVEAGIKLVGGVPGALPISPRPPGWSPGEGGPAAIPEEGTKITRCGCARDCATSGDPVCGSDGVVYASTCHLQEAACRGRVRLEPAPPSRCALGEDPPTPRLGDPTLSQNVSLHLLLFASGSLCISSVLVSLSPAPPQLCAFLHLLISDFCVRFPTL